LLQQSAGAIRPAMRKNIIQGVDPLPRFQHFQTVSFGLSHF